MLNDNQRSEYDFRVIRRNNTVTAFDVEKIRVAIGKAFTAQEGNGAELSDRVTHVCNQAVEAVTRNKKPGSTLHIEDIQDSVELALMRGGHQKVVHAYVIYREERARERQAEESADVDGVQVLNSDGSKSKPGDSEYVRLAKKSCAMYGVPEDDLVKSIERDLYDGMTSKEAGETAIMAARTLIEKDPEYTFITAYLLFAEIAGQAVDFLGFTRPDNITEVESMSGIFEIFIKKGVELELLDAALLEFDLDVLSAAIKPERTHKFTYLGLQTLYDRYFLHHEQVRFELPQAFFMRVSMGLALYEKKEVREKRAIEFYDILSTMRFMSSTPTLFNSATPRPQLSSCYLTTIPDDLEGIFLAIKDDALLSKYAGGLGNDWTPVRAMGAYIKGTNGQSQGVVPFLKVANDMAVAVNQGGKRKGAVCAYLETWHLDIEDFLELRKNTGDERRRTHDMNTANWVPDLFMKRVAEKKPWTLFSPHDVPELHDKYGKEFETLYESYEKKARDGGIKLWREVEAVELWRKMLSMLFETGHPWITFKDPCNIRSPQRHRGVVHSSNLCTEITLNTSAEEIAVCNLGSVNLVEHLDDNGRLDVDKLKKTIVIAMRMLDNVIDYNYYSVSQAERSNSLHRPVGLGVMGFQDALYKKGYSYQSVEAVEFADTSMELISYFAISASASLAQERGQYKTFKGSLWDQGILPIDSLSLLEKERGEYFSANTESRLDWDALRKKIKQHGMRNSNCLAIAPTATISNICGVSQSIEPCFSNFYVKSNLSGEFAVINLSLARKLKEMGVWDGVMINDLKHYDGSVQNIKRIPQDIKESYMTSFEIDPRWLVEAASRRQKWIDQGQSLNLYMSEPSGKKLDTLYKLAWVRGLKTTYYLRSMAATGAEVLVSQEGQYAPHKQDDFPTEGASTTSTFSACNIDDPDCEACQ